MKSWSDKEKVVVVSKTRATAGRNESLGKRRRRRPISFRSSSAVLLMALMASSSSSMYRMTFPMAHAFFQRRGLTVRRAVVPRVVGLLDVWRQRQSAVSARPACFLSPGLSQRQHLLPCRSMSSSTPPYSSERTIDLPQRVQDVLFRDIVPTVLSSSSLATAVDGATNTTAATIVLLVYVSGGCDSVALLHALVQAIQYESASDDGSNNKYKMHLIHFDHEQRGVDSTGDAEFVQELAHHYSLPCHMYKWSDYATNNTKEDNFSQDTARVWRRTTGLALIQELCKQETGSSTTESATCTAAAGLLLTAHHADDSTETLLLKMLRGAHLTNLRGMSLVVPVVSDDNSVNVQYAWVRPLLTTRKADIRHYLQATDRVWREDGSNASPKYRRNRIRNELWPLLVDLLGSEDAVQRRLDSAVQQSREIHSDLNARAEAYLLASGSSTAFSINREALWNLVHKQALHVWVRQQSNRVFSYEHLERVGVQIADYPSNRQWRLNIGKGWDVVRQGDTLRLENALSSNDDGEGVLTKAEASLHVLEWSLADSSTFNASAPCNTLLIGLPANQVSGTTRFVRDTVNLKETFTPPWRATSRPLTLKDFLRGQKVPLQQRDEAHVIRLITDKEDSSQLVAVHVVSKEAWIRNAAYDCDGSDELVPIFINL